VCAHTRTDTGNRHHHRLRVAVSPDKSAEDVSLAKASRIGARCLTGAAFVRRRDLGCLLRGGFPWAVPAVGLSSAAPPVWASGPAPFPEGAKSLGVPAAEFFRGRERTPFTPCAAQSPAPRTRQPTDHQARGRRRLRASRERATDSLLQAPRAPAGRVHEPSEGPHRVPGARPESRLPASAPSARLCAAGSSGP
jgi:hypothetical protein